MPPLTIKCRFCDQRFSLTAEEGSGQFIAALIFDHLSLDHPMKAAELMEKQKQLMGEYVEYI